MSDTTAPNTSAGNRPTLSSKAAAASVMLMFGTNGLAIGGWGGNLAAFMQRFDITKVQLSYVLFLSGIFGILAMQISGRLTDKIGARTVGLASIPLLTIALAVGAFAPNYAMFIVAGIFMGLGNGFIDVAQNALGVQVEQARGKAIMSFFHGFWSIGQFLGAFSIIAITYLTGLRGHAGIAPVLITLAVLSLVALAVGWFITPVAAPVVHHDETGAKLPIPRAAYLLGLMAIAFGLGEGVAMDWSGVHMREVAHVDPSTAAAGLSAVAFFMVVIRLVGDFLVNRFGRRHVVRFGGVCAALGYLIAVLATPFWLLMIGWALVGLGVGMIAPQVYAVAGYMGGGRGLAVVVTFGYATFLLGPVVIGYLSSHLGIQHTMIVPTVLMFGLLLLAKVMPKHDSELTGPAIPVNEPEPFA